MATSYYLIFNGSQQKAQLDTKDYSLNAAIKEAEKMNATKILKYETGSTQSMLVVWKRAS